MLAHLGDAGRIDERADLDAIFDAVADLELRNSGGKASRELVVHGGLDVDAIGADAGLAGIAVLGCQSALDGCVEIGVVEDDEGGVATELEAELLDLVCTLPHQDAANLGGSGEGDLRDVGAWRPPPGRTPPRWPP